VPDDTPETTPDERPMVATVVLPLTHVPPGEVLLNVVVVPWQRVRVPIIGESVTTVTTADAVQPGATWYIMVVDPGVVPDNTPLPRPMVATVVLLLVHVPPAGESVRDIVPPAQTVVGPTIAPGCTTVTVIEETHPNVEV